jgi:hypothetical protein
VEGFGYNAITVQLTCTVLMDAYDLYQPLHEGRWQHC